MLGVQSTHGSNPRLALTEERFRDLAAEEALGNATAEQQEWLRQPGNLDMWRDLLVDLVRRTHEEQTKRRSFVVEARHGGSREDYREAVAEHAAWSRRTSHFLRCVQGRLDEVKRLQRERDDRERASRRDELSTRVSSVETDVRRLTSAIIRLERLTAEDGAS